jgi:hypothetical protein
VEAGRQTEPLDFAYQARVHPNPFSSNLRTSPVALDGASSRIIESIEFLEKSLLDLISRELMHYIDTLFDCFIERRILLRHG